MSIITRAAKRRFIENEAEDLKSLVLFLMGSLGYEVEADRVARVSRNILESDQIVEGISRTQFLPKKRTRLMYAAMMGNLERLHFIASLGARVNQRTSLGASALYIASVNNELECARLLCDRGADINLASQDGWTALMAACAKVILISLPCYVREVPL